MNLERKLEWNWAKVWKNPCRNFRSTILFARAESASHPNPFMPAYCVAQAQHRTAHSPFGLFGNSSYAYGTTAFLQVDSVDRSHQLVCTRSRVRCEQVRRQLPTLAEVLQKDGAL
jgi:hypothetical protein